jgi:hypothetical protein
VISFVCSEHTRKRIARAKVGVGDGRVCRPQTTLFAKPSTKIYIWTALRKRMYDGMALVNYLSPRAFVFIEIYMGGLQPIERITVKTGSQSQNRIQLIMDYLSGK